MSPLDQDDPLRAAFSRLRHEVEPRVPDAARLFPQAQSARRTAPAWLVLSASLGAVLVLAFLNIRDAREMRPELRRPPHARALVLEGYPWRGPTDFLLDLPGVELTRTTPAFEMTSTLFPAIELSAPRGADGRHGERSTR